MTKPSPARRTNKARPQPRPSDARSDDDPSPLEPKIRTETATGDERLPSESVGGTDSETGTDDLVKAGFGRRFAALLVDCVVYLALLIPVIVTLAVGPTEWKPCRVEGGIVVSGGPPNAVCEQPTAGTTALALGFLALAIAASIVYVARLEGRTGQTLGARALGIRVVDLRTGQPLGQTRSIGRFFGSLLSRFVCFLGYFWMLWDQQHQTWHDKLTSAVVVKV